MVRQYKLLGRLQIEDDGRPATVMKYSKGCALLAYLIVTGQAHRREAVADLLWEASSTKESLRNLRALLHKIRSLVPELVISRKQLSLHAIDSVEIDYAVLVAALEQADPVALESALFLYQGVLLEGTYLDDAPRFNEWLLMERERFRQRVWTGFRRLCTVYQENQAWGEGVSLARHWLTLDGDGLDEEIHRQLMQFQAANGQIDAALQQYENCRQQLWAELAVEPEAETVELAHQLHKLKQEKAQNPPWVIKTAGESRVAIELPPPGELPPHGRLSADSYLPFPRNNVFTGREADLLYLAEALLPTNDLPAGMGPAVILTGMGGLGKSQLAVEYAYRFGRFYAGGVYWLSMAQANHVPEQLAVVGSERGMGLFQEIERLTLKEKTGRVQQAWQQEIPRLLIFDNCEEETLLANWLPVTGGCRVLVTSRRSFWSPALPINTRPLDVLQRTDSLHLLKQFVPTIAEIDADTIAAEVGDLPLALHLAGSFLAVNTAIRPAKYLMQLQEDNLLMHPSLRGICTSYSPTGHELHVARTFTVNFNQLDPANEPGQMARKLLARIACLAPGEPVSLDLLPDSVDVDQDNTQSVLLIEAAIARLLALGLLEIRGQDQVVMHRLLAIFIGEYLEDSGAQPAVEKTLCDAIESRFIEAGSLYSLPISFTHLRYLADVSLEREDLPAAKIATFMGSHLSDLGDYDEAAAYLLKALSIHKRLLGLNHADTASCLHNLAILHLRMGAYGKSRALIEQVLSIREEVLAADHQQTADTLNNLGHLLAQQGDYELAETYLERALEIYLHVLGREHARTATTLNNLGAVRMELGNYEKAQLQLQEALAIRRQVFGTEHPSVATSLKDLGLLQLKLGDFDAARHYLEESLRIREQEMGAMHPYTARSLNGLAELALKEGDYQAAQAHLEQAMTIQEAVLMPDHPDKALTLKIWGDLYLMAGEQEQAQPYYEHALVILEKSVEPIAPDFMHV